MPSSDLKALMGKVKRINKGEKFLVVPMLEKYYASLRDSAGTPGRFSPSMLGGCLRDSYYKYMGIEEGRTRDPMSMATLEDGRARHIRWANTFRDAGLLKEAEKELWIPEWHIHGFCDGILWIDDLDWVYELKGVRSEFFKQIVKGTAPREGDALQLHIYMKALDIPRGIIIYENKNDQRDVREFIYYKPDPIISFDLEQRMEILLEAVRTETPPEEPEGCVANSTMMNWCDRKDYCKSGS